MERFNPFSADSESSLADDPDPFSASPVRSQKRTNIEEANSDSGQSHAKLTSKYSTSFPDPFGDDHPLNISTLERETTTTTTTKTTTTPTKLPVSSSPMVPVGSAPPASSPMSNRSNSVTFLADEQTSGAQSTSRGRQASGFTSFLSRATSVTSSTVTDRVTGAVGTVRSAVDSLSTQIQQAVPSSSVIGGGAGSDSMQQAQLQQQQQQQQQSTASYLASKLSSATNQFTSSGQSSQSMPVISRQRVVLILDSPARIDWPHQFNQYKRLIAGLAPLASSAGSGSGTGSGVASGLSSFFSSQFASSAAAAVSSAVASATSSSSNAATLDGSDLIEQVDFGDISVLANQSSATAAVFLANSAAISCNIISNSNNNNPTSTGQLKLQLASKIIRPEYVVVRERMFKHKREHLRNIVKGLSYSSVAMLEPYEIWDTFQDRQLIFSRLLRVQKSLGKELFPLIPQIYCQTQQDLLNYINSASIGLPCLVRTGHLGKGKIRCDSMEMLRDLVSIMATSEQSCTIEPYLEVKYDLVVQRLGTSLKLFRRNVTWNTSNAANQQELESSYQPSSLPSTSGPNKQSATRQTSLGSGVLANLMGPPSPSPISQQQQQQQQQRQELSRVNSSSSTVTATATAAPGAFEKVSEVSLRYRSWVEAISREFDNKLDVLCVKIAVATNDREYIVGLQNCSMDFLGNQDNQDEDKRSFVELIISKMNTILPKHHHSSVSRESSSLLDQQSSNSLSLMRRISGEGNLAVTNQLSLNSEQSKRPATSTFLSQTELNNSSPTSTKMTPPTSSLRHHRNHEPSLSATTRGYGQLNNRSKSVSINQGDFGSGGRLASSFVADMSPSNIGNKSSAFHSPARRGSERSDTSQSGEGLAMNEPSSSWSSQSTAPPASATTTSAGLHQRQGSLGQSFLDQTSTALSSFHKQSLSFFKRLDQPLMGANTPPQSAKSDVAFDRDSGSAGWLAGQQSDLRGGPGGGGGAATAMASKPSAKSQSMDYSSALMDSGANRSPIRPPKPPPPPSQSMMNRQSSLASYSTRHQKPSDATATPNTTPTRTRQNSAAATTTTTTSSSSSQQFESNGSTTTTTTSTSRGRVVRQNSALSAFEPFDMELRSEIERETTTTSGPRQQSTGSIDTTSTKTTTKLRANNNNNNNSDAASMTSGDSNSTNETTTAEDTMNNLKKTFASIFGDKCE